MYSSYPFRVLAVVALLAAGCGKEEKLQILCGKSFLGPCDELVKQFTAEGRIPVETSADESESFLPKVKVGSLGDILITHDPYLDYVKEAGRYAGHAHVGFVAPVLVVRKGNPKGLKGIEDLAKPGLKVALTNPEYSTCGEMVFNLLEKKKIKDAVLENVGNRLTKGHNDVGTYLETGAVDAGIMWNGVANLFKDHVDIIPAETYEYDTEIGVHVIGLSYSQHREWMEQFVRFANTRGKEIFASYGYVK